MKLKKHILLPELLFLLIFDIVLFNLPLVNILGYEYSAVNAIVITLFSGIYIIHLIRKFSSKLIDEPELLKELFWGNACLLMLPLLLALLASLFIKNCSISQGFIFYLILAVPSAVVGTALGILARFISRNFSHFLLVVIFLVILFIPLLELYFNPQIYFFNPVFGFFSGTIYDESVAITFKLISYRILNIFYFGIIGLTLYKTTIKKDMAVKNFNIYFYASVLSSLILFLLLSSPLGFSTTSGRLKSELGGELETEHFSIFFDKAIDRKSLNSIALHAEYYFSSVNKYLNSDYKSRISLFLFLNAEQKKNLMGSEIADVSKPWLNHVYIDYYNYESTLKHEIAHCISGEFGTTILRLSAGLNPSLLEGIAMASENEYSLMTVHSMAALAFKSNYKYPVEKLFSGFSFFGQLSSLSYIYSGSFVRFLIDRYGIDSFKLLYASGKYENVYNKSLGELVREYNDFISHYDVRATAERANYYFGRQPIFKKICARFLAGKLNSAWDAFNSGNHQEAKEIFGELLTYSESYQSLIGYVQSLRELDQHAAALEVIDKNIVTYKTSSYYFSLELIKADLLALAGNTAEAGQLYASLRAQDPSIEYLYLSILRKALLNDSKVLKKYLNGSDFDKYTLLHRLNVDSVFSASVPVMLGLAEKFKENSADFINFFRNRMSVNNLPGAYAALRLSRYALKYEDFLAAKYFAEEAVNFKQDKDMTVILEENFNKVIWFNNFGPAARSKFKWLYTN